MARIGFLLHKPSNLLTAIRTWLLYRKHAPRLKGLAVHFNYWIYVWTNVLSSYYKPELSWIKQNPYEAIMIDGEQELTVANWKVNVVNP